MGGKNYLRSFLPIAKEFRISGELSAKLRKVRYEESYLTTKGIPHLENAIFDDVESQSKFIRLLGALSRENYIQKETVYLR